jgi:hypothetical protein
MEFFDRAHIADGPSEITMSLKGSLAFYLFHESGQGDGLDIILTLEDFPSPIRRTGTWEIIGQAQRKTDGLDLGRAFIYNYDPTTKQGNLTFLGKTP